jgi:hypothetical protein
MPSLIGNKPNQVPSNGDLGTLAFQDASNAFVENFNVNGVATLQTAQLQCSAIRGSNTAGDFTITVGGLALVTNSVWKRATMIVIYSGIDTDQTDSINLVTMVNFEGLASYSASVAANIVGTATITTANATTSGIDVTFDVPDNNFGSVLVLLLGGNTGTRPTISITP